ncbi:erythromycin esterase family protein [Lachnospiraceae bacterium LCP25S3_G4]
MKRIILVVLVLTLCISLFAGCNQSTPQLNNSIFDYDISSITISDTVRIVGLGEASHGASELQQLKADVFKALVANNNCRVFAIEGDFGGCAKVDEYIHGGSGTAEEVVSEIGFRIYHTQELADLVQWMREYNQTAAEGEALHFLGFDMQRYDNNKSFLMSYLRNVAPHLAEEYESKFADLTDEKMYDLKDASLASAESDISALISAMSKDINESEQNSSFDFALQCTQSMLENTQLRRNSTQYNTFRDTAMKNKVDWICNQYEGLIFINGHNGHIATESTSGYECMGDKLNQTYADEYFTIGTDVKQCEFNGQSGDRYKVFKVKNENVLTAQLDKLSEDFYYLDFSKAASDTAWQDVLNSSQKMLGLNVSFAAWQKLLKMTHTISVVPQQSYDAIIVLKSTTPTHLL